MNSSLVALLAVACAFAGCSRESSAVLPPSPVPPAPTLYAPDTSTTGSYTLSWTRPSQAVAFVVQESPDRLFRAPATAYAGPDTSCIISGKTAGAALYYRVRALNTAGSSPWSDTVSVTVIQSSPPSASVSPSLLDFGYVMADSSKTLPIILRNGGGVPLQGTCSVDNYPAFQVLDSTVFSLPPGDSCFILIRFAPTVEAAYAANFTVASNDPIHAALVVPVRGTSSSQSGEPDTIVALPPSDTVIDVSGSAGPHVSTLEFEARDSLGRHLDLAHSYSITFTLSGSPPTIDAYVAPTSASTDESGRAGTTLNAGMIPGVVQCVASLRRKTDGLLIQSPSVSVRIR